MTQKFFVVFVRPNHKAQDPTRITAFVTSITSWTHVHEQVAGCQERIESLYSKRHPMYRRYFVAVKVPHGFVEVPSIALETT